MVSPGDTLYNPLTGETFTFLKTAVSTQGERLQMDACIEPGKGLRIPPHFHPMQEQRMRITRGQMNLLLNGQERICEAGEAIIIPAGTPYNWSIAGDDELCFTIEYEPAGQWEHIFETLCALGHDKVAGKSVSILVGAAVVLDAYPNHLYYAGVPIIIQRVYLAVLALIGRFIGYRVDAPD
jgi:quercetin dioxygenase-like cupin family protein